MNSSLYKSIASGDIDHLKQVISANHLLLHQLTPLNNTALQVTVISNKIVCVKEICNRYPSLLTQPNSKGDTPLHIAARLGLSDIASFLINQAKINQEDIESIGEGNRGVVGAVPVQQQKLLRMRNNRKDTALHEAVRNHRFQVVKLLTEADPTFEYLECNDAGETPLYLAAENGLLDCVVQILQTCPSSAHAGPRGRTALHALHLASISQRAYVVKILSNENRVNKTIVNKDAFTAMNPVYNDLVSFSRLSNGGIPRFRGLYFVVMRVAVMLYEGDVMKCLLLGYRRVSEDDLLSFPVTVIPGDSHPFLNSDQSLQNSELNILKRSSS